ncbi:putative ATP-dependent endonuclease OLD family protein [Halorhabdus tiamatea SARL4B]|uniref:Putative ATP-dependent endonuclease OLD family protein n=1 Tax=Halorhabdus tiamatea SARL4B TaxID=1033806 RepID=F7PGU7_9EURY|nr:AAA family ATPase [Halorhabdus tiamatea]ERJ06720.1 putative ATP-dependent endonuclease OLD family protein [Halorhabdus tiamatea SARL4B]CCQ33911.1 SMC domain protein [Halorhabdus tiamatea SARL4B]
MELLNVNIQGYKSIRENQSIEINDLNVLLGENNVGKSSVIDALQDYQDIFPVANGKVSKWAHKRNTGKEARGEIRFELEFLLTEEEHRKFLEGVSEDSQLGEQKRNRWIENDQLRTIEHELILHSQRDPKAPLRGESNMYGNFRDQTVPLRIGTLQSGEYLNFRKLESESYGGGESSTDDDELIDDEILTEKRRAWANLKDVMEDSIESWNFIEAFRNPEGRVKATRDLDLDGTGENLSKVLLTLRGEKGDAFERISKEYADIMAGVDGIRAPLPEEDQTTVVVDEKQYDTGFNLNEVSAGSKEILTLITKIILSETDTDLLLVEEPELHLHPGAERKILDLINDELVNKCPQVIMSTHSSVFVHHLDVKNVYRVKREEDTKVYSTSTSAIGADLRELGYEYAGMFQSEAVVLVEGLTDRVALRCIGEKYGLDFDEYNIGVLELGSGSQLVTHAKPVSRLLEVFNIPYLFICDSDLEDELKKNGDPADTPEKIEGRIVGKVNSDSSRKDEWSDLDCDDVHAWRETELEHYLLQDLDTLENVFTTLDVDEIEEDLEDTEGQKPEARLDDLITKNHPGVSEMKDEVDKTTYIEEIARTIRLEELPNEFHDVMEDIGALVDARNIVSDGRPSRD